MWTLRVDGRVTKRTKHVTEAWSAYLYAMMEFPESKVELLENGEVVQSYKPKVKS